MFARVGVAPDAMALRPAVALDPDHDRLVGVRVPVMDVRVARLIATTPTAVGTQRL
jgi:hypothetical protein